MRLLLLVSLAVVSSFGDDCIPGEVASKCYYFVDTPSSYDGAARYCTDRNAQVVSIHNAFTQQFVYSKARGLLTDDFWVGYTDPEEDGRWRWEDGVKSNYSNWASGFPMDGDHLGCTGALLSTGKWYNQLCSETHSFVCNAVVPLPTTTLSPDVWYYFNVTNAFYKVIENVAFDEAEDRCVGERSHLVSIHSGAENAFVANLVRSVIGQQHCYTVPRFFSAQTWIGLVISPLNVNISWVDGSAFSYSAFGASRPVRANMTTCAPLATTTTDDCMPEWKDLWENIYCKNVLRAAVCKRNQ